MAYEKVRRFPRIKSANPVTLTIASDKPSLPALSVELSEGGCLVRAKSPSGEGRIVLVNILLDGQTLRAIGKVLYEYPDADGTVLTGIAFVSLFQEELGLLRTFIRERLAELEVVSDAMIDAVGPAIQAT